MWAVGKCSERSPSSWLGSRAPRLNSALARDRTRCSEIFAVEASLLDKDPQRPHNFRLTLAGSIVLAAIVITTVHQAVQHYFGPKAAATAAGIAVAICGLRPIHRETESVLGTIVTAMLAGLVLGVFALLFL